MGRSFDARRVWRFRLAAAAWTVLLLIGFWLPGPLTRPPFPGADKLFHAAGFFVLGALTVRGLPLRPAPLRIRWMWTVFAAAVLATVSEVGQDVLTQLSPVNPDGTRLWNRDGDLLDALADLVGAALGASTGGRQPRHPE